MIDEAFLPFSEIIAQLTAFNGTLQDDEAGVRSYIHEFTVEMPVEMDIVKDGDNPVQIGTVPPLYDVNTSFKPSYHFVRFTATLDENEEPGNEVIYGR